MEIPHFYAIVIFSKGDLLTLFEKMNEALNNQVNKIARTIKLETNKFVTNCPRTFDPIHSKISHFAIQKTMEQWHIGHKPDAAQICTHTFEKTWGIPCHHRLRQISEANQKLTEKDYHHQWHLNHNPCLPEDVSLHISCGIGILFNIFKELTFDLS